jgi:hypothetical protein
MELVGQRIDGILEARRLRLPQVREEIVRWRRVHQQLTDLSSALEELRDHATTPPELRERLRAVRAADAAREVEAVVELFRVVENRFQRETVNVGVSGQARVGKSTLLQSISGLTNEQIPTGRGLPVTAVRSRIYHSTVHERATLHHHSPDTFLAAVIAPYHAELGLAGVPASLEQFAAWPYPDADGLDANGFHSRVALLRRLRGLQESLPGYRADLTGTARSVSLSALRPYVAYPTNDELESAGRPARRYAAVREARIECVFPHAQVARLGIIDLPGLGELEVDADEHHVAGLQNEVDVVVLVKRPVEGMAFWGEADARALNLLDQARGFVRNRGDFVFLLINSGDADPGLAASLRDDLRRQVNDGTDGRFFTVLEADATSQADVFENVLVPVLGRIAERLPAMDAEILEGTRERAAQPAAAVRDLLGDVSEALALLRRTAGGGAEELGDRTAELRKDLATSLALLLADLRDRARANGGEDPEYVAVVNGIHDRTRAWIRAGLGHDPDAWRANAVRTMRTDGSSGPLASEELNRVRVEISKRYSDLDDFFTARLAGLWADVAAVFSVHFGELIGGRSGPDALAELGVLLAAASEPCPALQRAVEELLRVRVEFRTQLYPRVRQELDVLRYEVEDPLTGGPVARIAVERDEAGAETLLRFIQGAAEQAVHLTRKALLEESVTPTLILYAVLEHFEDTFIRSGTALRELQRFTRAYRAEIWPQVYRELDEASAFVARVTRLCGELAESLAGDGGEAR